MSRMPLRLVLAAVVAVVVVTGTAAASALAAPAGPARIGPGPKPAPQPVVYLPECHPSEVVPAADSDRQCPGESATVPEKDCQARLPGDYAIVPQPVDRGGRPDGPQVLVVPRPPERVCTQVVPATVSLPARP